MMRGVLAVALVAWSLVARAGDDPELAKRHFETGKLLYSRASYVDALHEFEAARTSLNSPMLDYNLGMCLVSLDRREEAADAFERYAVASPGAEGVGEVWQRIAKLRATHPDGEQHQRDERRALGRRLRLAGAGVLGVGAGLLVAAIPVGVEALDERNAYRSGCSARMCDDSLYHRSRDIAMVTDSLIGVGVAITATGIALVGVSARRVRVPATVPAKGAP